MESTRQKKVSRLIQKEIALVLHHISKEILGSIMVSVTLVRISPDLAEANIFLSIFPAENPSEAMSIIKNKTSIIRKKLAEKIRYQLRIVPTLQFHIDNSAAYAEEIDRLLKNN